jgi:hypothetical protein
MPVKSLSTAPNIKDRIVEEYREMVRLRAHYSPGLCRPGTDSVFESGDVGTVWFAGWLPHHNAAYVQSLLGRTGTEFRLGTQEPAKHGRLIYRSQPVTSMHEAVRSGDVSMYSKPLVVAKEVDGTPEVGVGVSLRRASLMWVDPEAFGKMPYRTYDERRSERLGVIAITIAPADDSTALLRVRTIAGQGYDLFDEEAGGRVAKSYTAGGERADAILGAFHQAYWESVCEPI